MPYLIYRCDLTDSLDGKPQALRFKAVLMSDKFNIQDEIDVSCALNPSTLLSPVHVDGSYFDLKSFEAKKGEELLTPQAMAGKVSEWINHQMQKRRGKKIFVPSRGGDVDQVNMQIMFDQNLNIDLPFNWAEAEEIDVQTMAEDILMEKKIEANDNFFPSDIVAEDLRLRPRQYLPFYMEKGNHGEMQLPAFQSAVATIQAAGKERLKDFTSSFEPLETPQWQTRKKPLSEKTVIKARLDGEDKYLAPFNQFTVEGISYCLLVDLSQKINADTKRKSQKGLSLDMALEEGPFMVVRSDAIPRLETLRPVARMPKRIKKAFAQRNQEFSANKRFLHNIEKAARKFVRTRQHSRDVFNAHSMEKTAQTNSADLVEEKSTQVNFGVCLSYLLEKGDKQWMTFHKAREELKDLANLLPGDNTRYIKEWENYLEKYYKDMRRKATRQARSNVALTA